MLRKGSNFSWYIIVIGIEDESMKWTGLKAFETVWSDFVGITQRRDDKFLARRGRLLPSRLPFANFTTVIWRSLGYLLLGMATPWPHGKLTNFTERDHKTRWEKSGFYEREELSWTFIGFVKALGIHLSSEYRICTCSRVKREEERERERKKKRKDGYVSEELFYLKETRLERIAHDS